VNDLQIIKVMSKTP